MNNFPNEVEIVIEHDNGTITRHKDPTLLFLLRSYYRKGVTDEGAEIMKILNESRTGLEFCDKVRERLDP